MINFTYKTLTNGTRLVLAPQDDTQSVTILFLVGTGGRFEKKTQMGISHFLEHLFFKGSKNYPSAFDISKKLDALGANYNAFTGEEATGFYVQSNADDFETSFQILSDMFMNPLFPPEEVEREKGVILEEANMHRDIPQAHVQLMAQRQMYPDLPLGNDIVGTPESIKATTRDDIFKYFKNYYVPGSTIVVVAGNMKNKNWEKQIDYKFSLLDAKPKKDFQQFLGPSVREKVVQEIRTVDQAHLVFSTLTFPRIDDSRYALAHLNYILGGGMSSRLFRQIRERRGWAYYVRSVASPYFDTGLISFLAGVKKDKLVETIKIILDEISDLAKNGPTDEELIRAKSNLRGNLAISLESSDEIAEFLSSEIYFEQRPRQPEEIIDKSNAVKPEEIKKISQDIFKSDRMGLAVIGPEDKKTQLAKLLK